MNGVDFPSERLGENEQRARNAAKMQDRYALDAHAAD